MKLWCNSHVAHCVLIVLTQRSVDFQHPRILSAGWWWEFFVIDGTGAKEGPLLEGGQDIII